MKGVVFVWRPARGAPVGCERKRGEAARVQIVKTFSDRKDKVCFGYEKITVCDNNKIIIKC